uniref:Uncharacterized protein n=1 Tax=Oryza rufipogon TaxID=4529 RepID=A0A0G2KBQ6_ORYRU
MGAGHDYYI